MGLHLGALGRSAVPVALGTLLGALLVACPAPQSPKGPPPEYEEPAAPSWFDAGTPGAPGASAEASAPPPAPPVPAAGAVPPQYILP